MGRSDIEAIIGGFTKTVDLLGHHRDYTGNGKIKYRYHLIPTAVTWTMNDHTMHLEFTVTLRDAYKPKHSWIKLIIYTYTVNVANPEDVITKMVVDATARATNQFMLWAVYGKVYKTAKGEMIDFGMWRNTIVPTDSNIRCEITDYGNPMRVKVVFP